MVIIKIGGGSSLNLPGIAAGLNSIDKPYIIVHGANALRDELAEKLNSPLKRVTSVSGYSSVFSDEEVINLQMMAYAGLKNKRLVELLHQQGINAVGLSGLDGAVIRGKRNPGIRTRQDGKLKLLKDFSGKPVDINTHLLQILLDNGYVPVLTVPIIDENNQAINSENDDIVALLNKKLNADKIIHFIEEAGFLDNPDNKNSVIPKLNRQELFQREEKAEGRIKRKLHSIKKLLDDGAGEVIIADGTVENPLEDINKGKGTHIQ